MSLWKQISWNPTDGSLSVSNGFHESIIEHFLLQTKIQCKTIFISQFPLPLQLNVLYEVGQC